MFTRSLVMTSCLALTAPALAQEAANTFEYSPVVRLMHNGKFRAEVWRRDVGTDQSDLAWSDSELSATATTAIVDACAALQRNFDGTFPCMHAGNQGAEGVAAHAAGAAAILVGRTTATPAPQHKLVKVPVKPPSTAAEPDTQSTFKDFSQN